MALSSSDLPTSILFCRLCQSLYRQPRTLPCLHSFCLDCLQHLAPTTNTQGQATLDCPLCGQEALLPPGGVPALTCNEFLARMCQEYVGEVQRTLVTTRSMSPAGSVGRQDPGQRSSSPASVIAGRAPAGHFQYSTPSHCHQPSYPAPSSPGRAQTHHSPMTEPAFHGRHSSSGASPSFQHMSSPASSPGYLSPSRLPSSPHRSRSSSSASDAVLQTARRLSSETLPSRGVGVQRRLSSTPQDIVRTWECLQRKVNSLQSASLKVTYSLEIVNMAEANWHQRKQDLRRDVQRRSAQLQFFIKRQERLLLAALDARKTDDSFNTAVEQARSELRTNLKSLMHEIDVLRSVLDLATDTELMSLSGLLLNSKVSQTPVNMETPELRFMVPEELSLEDMVGKDFGCLTSTPMTHSIFTPEDIVQVLPEDPEEDDAFSMDASTVNASSTDGATSPTASDNFENSFDDVAYIDDDEEEELVVEETLEFIDGKMQVVSKTSAPLSKTRPQAAETTDSKDQIKRGRGTDVRRTVNSTVTGQTTKDEETRPKKRRGAEKADDKQPTPEVKEDADGQANGSDPQNSIDKFQSLRESLKQKRRELLLNTSVFPPQGPPGMAHLLRGEKRVQSLDRTGSMREPSRRSFSPLAPKYQQTPSIVAPVIHTPTHSPDKQFAVEHSHAAMVLSDPGITVETSVVSTSAVSPTSPTDKNTRPVRRAISAASDRASKMEYLRETWRKRKELLIQNEGYITTPTPKPEDGKSTTHVGAKDSGEQENGGDGATSPTGPKPKIKHSIRSRISNLKHALKKNGKSEEGTTQESQPAATGSVSENTVISKTAFDKSARSAAQAAAQKNVLKTIESILQKKHGAGTETELTTKSPLPSQPGLPETSPTSPGTKPSMVVKPCPRDPAPNVASSTDSTPHLETLPEDDGKTAVSARRPGLRVTSPARGDANKEKLQQVRANIRQKKERWRSLSLN